MVRPLMLLLCLLTAALAEPLPRPKPHIPPLPPLPPTVITPGDQRLLLSQSDVSVTWDVGRQVPVVSRPGYWLINYPWSRVAGLQDSAIDGVAMRLTGHRTRDLRNWVFHTPGKSPEPAAPTGPAPIEPTENPTLIVDQQSAAADDNGPGTAARPLRSLGAAVRRAQPGSVIWVRPGLYRESITLDVNGAAEAPIRLEGIRDARGQMPILSGNDAFPADAWRRTAWPGVWRADLFTQQEGPVSADGRALTERKIGRAHV